jgi:hypothetical protein
MRHRNQLVIALALFIFLFANPSFALDQNEKLWLAINSQQKLTADKKWLSFIYSQFRFINKTQPWQTGLIEGGLGYHVLEDSSIWVGYRWSAQNPNNGFFQENRLFQQFLGITRTRMGHQLIARTRLEEVQRGNESKIALRFRQRFGIEINKSFIFSHVFPVLYEEIFFQLNQTHYTSHTFFSENRIFLGLNFYETKNTWLEIGYMNQYQMHTPLITQNQMSHVLSLTYNFF